MAEVGVDGAARDVELGGEFLVGASVAEEAEQLPLAVGEVVDGSGGGGRDGVQHPALCGYAFVGWSGESCLAQCLFEVCASEDQVTAETVGEIVVTELVGSGDERVHGLGQAVGEAEPEGHGGSVDLAAPGEGSGTPRPCDPPQDLCL